MKLWQRRIFGVLALGGGFLGLSLTLMQLFKASGVLNAAILLPFAGLYAWGIWCGLQIIEDGYDALRVNQIFWALQIPLLTSPIFSYSFASGALFYVSMQPFDLKCSFDMDFGSQFAVSLFQDKPVAIGINVFAAYMSYVLTRHIRKAESSGGDGAASQATESPG
jgi:hypothetical protein